MLAQVVHHKSYLSVKFFMNVTCIYMCCFFLFFLNVILINCLSFQSSPGTLHGVKLQ